MAKKCFPWRLTSNFRAKLKNLKFGTKNSWFGCFWPGIWKKYCHIRNLCPRLCLIAIIPLICLILWKKRPHFWTKVTYLVFSALEFYKIIIIFEISTLEFAKNEFLTCGGNFGKRSTFSEDLGPIPGLLYKVLCLKLLQKCF